MYSTLLRINRRFHQAVKLMNKGIEISVLIQPKSSNAGNIFAIQKTTGTFKWSSELVTSQRDLKVEVRHYLSLVNCEVALNMDAVPENPEHLIEFMKQFVVLTLTGKADISGVKAVFGKVEVANPSNLSMPPQKTKNAIILAIRTKPKTLIVPWTPYNHVINDNMKYAVDNFFAPEAVAYDSHLPATFTSGKHIYGLTLTKDGGVYNTNPQFECFQNLRFLNLADTKVDVSNIDTFPPNLRTLEVNQEVGVQKFLLVAGKANSLKHFNPINVDDPDFCHRLEHASPSFNLQRFTSLGLLYNQLDGIDLAIMAADISRPFPNLKELQIANSNNQLPAFGSFSFTTQIHATTSATTAFQPGFVPSRTTMLNNAPPLFDFTGLRQFAQKALRNINSVPVEILVKIITFLSISKTTYNTLLRINRRFNQAMKLLRKGIEISLVIQPKPVVPSNPYAHPNRPSSVPRSAPAIPDSGNIFAIQTTTGIFKWSSFPLKEQMVDYITLVECKVTLNMDAVPDKPEYLIEYMKQFVMLQLTKKASHSDMRAVFSKVEVVSPSNGQSGRLQDAIIMAIQAKPKVLIVPFFTQTLLLNNNINYPVGNFHIGEKDLHHLPLFGQPDYRKQILGLTVISLQGFAYNSPPQLSYVPNRRYLDLTKSELNINNIPCFPVGLVRIEAHEEANIDTFISVARKAPKLEDFNPIHINDPNFCHKLEVAKPSLNLQRFKSLGLLFDQFSSFDLAVMSADLCRLFTNLRALKIAFKTSLGFVIEDLIKSFKLIKSRSRLSHVCLHIPGSAQKQAQIKSQLESLGLEVEGKRKKRERRVCENKSSSNSSVNIARTHIPNIIESYETGDMVCGDCGLVFEGKIIDTSPEWRTFADSDDTGPDPNRVGTSGDSLLDDGLLDDTKISLFDAKGHRVAGSFASGLAMTQRKIQTINNTTVEGSSSSTGTTTTTTTESTSANITNGVLQCLQEGVQHVNRILRVLSIDSKAIQNAAISVLKAAVKHNWKLIGSATIQATAAAKEVQNP
ncbi:transcription initiation factor IIB [Blyttiomyces sp. JEL0837]|nr:transcription initiation factor IIB [Blyttiomyces sp. JEL0837]